MDHRFKQFEKLIYRLLVPKINELFSEYSDLRISTINVHQSDWYKKSYDMQTDDTYDALHIPITIRYNQEVEETLTIASMIGYLINNISSYVFMEDILIDIDHIFPPHIEINTGYYSRQPQRVDDEYAYNQLKKSLY